MKQSSSSNIVITHKVLNNLINQHYLERKNIDNPYSENIDKIANNDTKKGKNDKKLCNHMHIITKHLEE